MVCCEQDCHLQVTDIEESKVSSCSVEARSTEKVVVVIVVVVQHVHVMKVQTADEVLCYVTPLNRSQATPPQVYAARNTDVDVCLLSVSSV